ncbi:hypothetical protein WJX84_006846 [Apatococcus fuscideae]|uniref:Uncharacterized protein n=1 Tax=Apatococcus fuscideae TaxID=2026836 RepID=A0AAW1TE96_9CHLO
MHASCHQALSKHLPSIALACRYCESPTKLSHALRSHVVKKSIPQRAVPEKRQTTHNVRRDIKPAALPQPYLELAQDTTYYLQLVSFALLGGLVIYFTLNYITASSLRRKAEEAKKAAEEEAAAAKKKGGLFGFLKK